MKLFPQMKSLHIRAPAHTSRATTATWPSCTASAAALRPLSVSNAPSVGAQRLKVTHQLIFITAHPEQDPFITWGLLYLNSYIHYSGETVFGILTNFLLWFNCHNNIWHLKTYVFTVKISLGQSTFLAHRTFWSVFETRFASMFSDFYTIKEPSSSFVLKWCFGAFSCEGIIYCPVIVHPFLVWPTQPLRGCRSTLTFSPVLIIPIVG